MSRSWEGRPGGDMALPLSPVTRAAFCSWGPAGQSGLDIPHIAAPGERLGSTVSPATTLPHSVSGSRRDLASGPKHRRKQTLEKYRDRQDCIP